MKTAEEILKKLTPKYSSFPAFLENEHSCDNIEREYNEEAKALHIGGVSNRYQVTDIKLADWESVAIGDTETNKVVCHFITENGFDEAVEMAKNITKYLNGC